MSVFKATLSLPTYHRAHPLQKTIPAVGEEPCPQDASRTTETQVQKGRLGSWNFNSSCLPSETGGPRRTARVESNLRCSQTALASLHECCVLRTPSEGLTHQPPPATLLLKRASLLAERTAGQNNHSPHSHFSETTIFFCQRL